MEWLKTYTGSSIGRKQLMGKAGVLLAIWLLLHMLGNIPLLSGNADAYNQYSHLLTSKKGLLYAMEVVCAILLLVHFGLAIKLRLGNSAARPVKYAVNVKVGKRSAATFTMIYSGIWILVFLALHLKTIKFGTHYETTIDGVVMRDMYKTTIEEFGQLWYVIFYAFSMTVLGLHLSHAIGAVLQTYGLNHPKYNGIIKTISVGYAVVIGVGFTILAVGAHIFGRGM
jgi:succinate dehydrogenase / fumarate reductase cytochrome b subunit